MTTAKLRDILLTSLAFFLFLSTSVHAIEHIGKVVSVSDGDTVKILVSSNKELKIRLAQIDAPEKSQPFGKKSKQSLSDMILRAQIRVVQEDIDRYGRIVGRIYKDNLDINAEQVRRGMAWVYRRYASDPSFFELEKEAKLNKRGLWQDAKPTPPWEYRRTKRSQKRKPQENRKSFDANCSSKRYCKEMTSCKEARFYLNECGLSRLDRDKDGIPCESLCN